MDNITIKMLAEKLGTSVATVSKALRDSHEISIETKLRIKEMAKDLGYVPNLYASSLKKRRSKTIAVVLPAVADSFFSQAINGIESIAQEKGYHVLIYLSHENFEKEQAILKDFQSGRVDGVLMSISSESASHQHISKLHNNGTPIVFFDRCCEEMDTAQVATNDFESGYNATQHLIVAGCERIALLTISNSLSISNKRMAGYEKALLEHGIQPSPQDVLLCGASEAENIELTKQLLKTKNRPDGIISTVEKLATSCYLACKELGLKIPGDVKMVCFSNLPAVSILNPSLTTITQPAFEMGAAAATILFKALAKPTMNLKNESVVIPSALMIRDSSRN